VIREGHSGTNLVLEMETELNRKFWDGVCSRKCLQKDQRFVFEAAAGKFLVLRSKKVFLRHLQKNEFLLF